MTATLKTTAIAVLLTASFGAFAQSTPSTEARPIPATDASLVPPDMTGAATTRATPVQQAASSLVLLPARSKRVLVPRSGNAVSSGISGVSGSSNQSGGRSNGINDGADPSRGSSGAGGGIGAAPLGSRPLSPRDDGPQRKL